MRLENIFIILTLVLMGGLGPSIGSAAPTADVYPPKPLETETKESYSRPYQKGGPSAYYLSSLDVTAGYLSGKIEHDEENKGAWVARFAKTNYNLDSSSQHFGIDILSNNMIGWNLGFRKLFTPEEYWEPFWSGELVTIYSPKDGLGNFINLKRYFFAVGLGLDDVFASRRRIHAEIQVRVGQAGVHGYAGVTASFPTDF